MNDPIAVKGRMWKQKDGRSIHYVNKSKMLRLEDNDGNITSIFSAENREDVLATMLKHRIDPDDADHILIFLSVRHGWQKGCLY